MGHPMNLYKKVCLTLAFVASMVMLSFAQSEYTLISLGKRVESMLNSTDMLKLSMDGDMMHDAIRGDMLLALKAAGSGDQKTLEEAKADFKEHSERFTSNITEIISKTTSPKIKSATEETFKTIQVYIGSGQKMLESLAQDPSGTQNFPVFQNAFGDLEGKMEVLGDFIMSNAKADRDGYQNEQSLASYLSWGGLGLVILVLAGFSYFILSRIMAPIRQMITTMGVVSGGDYTTQIPGLERTDEIGDMAKSLNVFQEKSKEVETMNAQRQHMAEEQNRKVKDEMLKLSNMLDQEVQAVVSKIRGEGEVMLTQAENMRTLTKSLETQSQEASMTSENANSSVKNVAFGTDELSASIQEISQQVSQATAITQKASSAAQSTHEDVKKLSETAGKIGDIISLISNIAEQTNLLALNATIEAARAGEAGKGFAVVANEVKNLASQTSQATTEISSQITEIQTAVGETVNSISDILETIINVDSISSSIAAAVEEQRTATENISQNTQEAASGTGDVSIKIGEVSSKLSDAGGFAGELYTSVESMTGQVVELQDRLRALLRNSEAGDRRASKRYKPNNYAIDVNHKGADKRVAVIDISIKGVAIDPTGFGFAKGDSTTLTLPGLTDQITGKVAGVDDKRARIEFALNDAQKDMLTKTLEGTPERAAA